MKLLIDVLVALAVAVGIVLLAANDTGYVLIARNPWRIEMSLTLFLLLALVLFVVLYVVVRVLVRLRRTPRDLGAWRAQRLDHKAQQRMVSGFLNSIEGDWRRAEKQLVSATRHSSETPLLGYIVAAHSAQQRGDTGSRDRYLASAREEVGAEHRLAVLLTQARLQHDSGDDAAALATLEELSPDEATNSRVLQLRLDIHRRRNEWQRVLELLPSLRKRNVLPDDELESLARSARVHRLQQVAAQAPEGEELARLRAHWDGLGNHERRDPVVLLAYCRRVNALGDADTAEGLIRQALKRDWDAELVRQYGLVRTDDPAQQLRHAEKWIAGHESDAVLLLALGRLAMAAQLWGKAQSYLETCVASGGDEEAWRELGRLMESLGERERALECYRRGLEQSLPAALPEPPVPEEQPEAPAERAAAG